MEQPEFQKFIKDAVEKVGMKAIGRRFSISTPSVQRWIDGESMPQPCIIPMVIWEVTELIEESGNKGNISSTLRAAAELVRVTRQAEKELKDELFREAVEKYKKELRPHFNLDLAIDPIQDGSEVIKTPTNPICKTCNGIGEVYCCNDHMCPGGGYKVCPDCNGQS